MPAPAILALVHADVEAVAVRDLGEHAHRRLGEATDLGDLLRRGLVIGRNVAVRAHQQVTAVVREQVEQHVGVLAAGDDERLLVATASGATQNGHSCRPAACCSLDVDDAVRRPEALEGVRDGREVGSTFSDARVLGAVVVLTHPRPGRGAMASVMRAIASAIGMPFSCVPSRKRKLTEPLARSSSPAMSWNGTFCVVCVRIFFGIRSLESSSSARTPVAFSWSMTSPR